ncbi:MAG: hypothetical protein CL561_10990 [Alphaproteobacteria bacterium]|nr:hypothetical protein [Alphaproteobacteria bacterium]|tara:strand:- start:840 stop:1388 length:549 start_codon:yes stop_codon:yes gene_type:complete
MAKAGGIVSIFGVAAFGLVTLAILTAEPDENPYGAAPADGVNTVTLTAQNISVTKTGDLHYARTLPDGLHVVYDKRESEYFLVLKDRYSGIEEGFGYFGIDRISEKYVPNTSPNSSGNEFSIWTLAEAKDVLPEEYDHGKFEYKINGNALNGYDLRFTLIKDRYSGIDEGFGYMGLSVQPSL